MSDEHKRLWWQAFSGLETLNMTNANVILNAMETADFATTEFYEKFGPDPAPASGAYEGWAYLEIMGHRAHYGRVREIRAYGAKLIEIQCLDDKGELSDEIHQYGGGAIFANNPMDEETCRHHARGEELFSCNQSTEENGTVTFVCHKKTWRGSDADRNERAYCDEHQPKESEDDSDMPW